MFVYDLGDYVILNYGLKILLLVVLIAIAFLTGYLAGKLFVVIFLGLSKIGEKIQQRVWNITTAEQDDLEEDTDET